MSVRGDICVHEYGDIPCVALRESSFIVGGERESRPNLRWRSGDKNVGAGIIPFYDGVYSAGSI